MANDDIYQGGLIASKSLSPTQTADAIAADFLKFVQLYELTDAMTSMSSRQIQVLALFVGHLLRQPPKRLHISERLDLLRKKSPYVPADMIESPQVPHFVKTSHGKREYCRACVAGNAGVILVPALRGRLRDDEGPLEARSKGTSFLGGV